MALTINQGFLICPHNSIIIPKNIRAKNIDRGIFNNTLDSIYTTSTEMYRYANIFILTCVINIGIYTLL